MAESNLKPWRKWHGGTCPFDSINKDDSPLPYRVYVKLRSGQEMSSNTPFFWVWNHFEVELNGDIVAYYEERVDEGIVNEEP